MSFPLTFRNLTCECDYPLLLELNRSSRQADNDPEPITLKAIANVLASVDTWFRKTME